MSNFLITGGAGFIGSHIADALSKDKASHVVILDNLLTGLESNIPKRKNIVLVKGDVNESRILDKIFAEYEFEYVFHYAAVVGVDRTLKFPLRVLDDIDGFKYLLQHCRKGGVKRIYFSSSSEVYGESPEFPQDEESTPLNSRLPYAIVKNVGEAYLKSYHQVSGLEYTIFRFFNTYGPRQNNGFVIAKFIAAAQADKDITIYGDGLQTRTFCYIDDNIEATINAFRNSEDLNEVVNIGSDIEISINELAKTIVKLTGSKSKIVHLPPLKEGDMQRRLPVVNKMRELLSHDFMPIEDGIKATLKYNSSAKHL